MRNKRKRYVILFQQKVKSLWNKQVIKIAEIKIKTKKLKKWLQMQYDFSLVTLKWKLCNKKLVVQKYRFGV